MAALGLMPAYGNSIAQLGGAVLRYWPLLQGGRQDDPATEKLPK